LLGQLVRFREHRDAVHQRAERGHPQPRLVAMGHERLVDLRRQFVDKARFTGRRCFRLRGLRPRWGGWVRSHARVRYGVRVGVHVGVPVGLGLGVRFARRVVDDELDHDGHRHGQRQGLAVARREPGALTITPTSGLGQDRQGIQAGHHDEAEREPGNHDATGLLRGRPLGLHVARILRSRQVG